MRTVWPARWTVIFLGIVIGFVQGCDDENARWVSKSSTGHKLQATNPSSSSALRRGNVLPAQFDRPGQDQSEQKALTATAQAPQKQRLERENIPSSQRKAGNLPQGIEVSHVALHTRAPVPHQVKTDEEEPLGSQFPQNQNANTDRQGGAGRPPKDASFHVDQNPTASEGKRPYDSFVFFSKESFEISQIPLPGIEAIAVPESTTKSTATGQEQKGVQPKVHVVSIHDRGREPSVPSAEQKFPAKDSSTASNEKLSDMSLNGERPEQKNSVSGRALQLPHSNFVVTPHHNHAKNPTEAEAESTFEGGAKRDSTIEQAFVPSEALDACEKGREHAAQLQYQAAIKSFSQSIRLSLTTGFPIAQRSRLLDCYRQRAHAFFQSQDLSQALSDINRVLQDSKHDGPRRPDDFFFRGRVYAASKDARRAIEDLSTALTLGLSTHEEATAYYLRGLSNLRLRRLQAGLKDLSRGCMAKHAEACRFLEKIL